MKAVGFSKLTQYVWDGKTFLVAEPAEINIWFKMAWHEE